MHPKPINELIAEHREALGLDQDVVGATFDFEPMTYYDIEAYEHDVKGQYASRRIISLCRFLGFDFRRTLFPDYDHLCTGHLENVSAFLRRLMRERALSDEEVADVVGYEPVIFDELDSGSLGSLSMFDLEDLAAFLNVPPALVDCDWTDDPASSAWP